MKLILIDFADSMLADDAPTEAQHQFAAAEITDGLMSWTFERGGWFMLMHWAELTYVAPYCAKLAGPCPDGCTGVAVLCGRPGEKHGDCWRVKQPSNEADSLCPHCGSEEWDHVTAERGRERDVPFSRCNRCEREWGSSTDGSGVVVPVASPDLREAAKQFYNLTLADPEVIIRPPNAVKQEAITKAGQCLRIALTAGVSGTPLSGCDAAQQEGEKK